MDPYVVVRFGPQEFKGAVIKKGGKNPKFTDRHQFIVNSYYKNLGRSLEIEVMDSNIGSDDVIGFGIIDLDPYLNALQVSSPSQEMTKSKGPGPDASSPIVKRAVLRCFLTYDRKQAGFVVIEASFKEEKTDLLSFRFETAEFQRSTRTFGDMDCYVRVTAGE